MVNNGVIRRSLTMGGAGLARVKRGFVEASADATTSKPWAADLSVDSLGGKEGTYLQIADHPLLSARPNGVAYS